MTTGRRKRPENSASSPWVVDIGGCKIACSICGKPIKRNEVRQSLVKFELVPLGDGDLAAASGCKFELKYKGERFGIKQAMHEACLA